MSATTCAKCLRPQSNFASPLKRCGRCQQARYCSTECQRADWPRHKRGCAPANVTSNASLRHRATCRLHMDDYQPQENDTIFFVRKKLPHLNDISLAGPFYPRQAIVEQFRGYFHRTSTAGMSLVDEIAEDEDQLRRLVHINAPLDADPTKFMFIEIIEQHNPVMATRLPCPAYNVTSGELLLSGRTIRQEGEFPEMKNTEIHGCFAQKNEAVTKAREVIRDAEKTFKGCSRRELPESEHTYSCAIVGIGPDDRQKAIAVDVRYDTGVTRQT